MPAVSAGREYSTYGEEREKDEARSPGYEGSITERKSALHRIRREPESERASNQNCSHIAGHQYRKTGRDTTSVTANRARAAISQSRPQLESGMRRHARVYGARPRGWQDHR
jgi:hypothetical protein